MSGTCIPPIFKVLPSVFQFKWHFLTNIHIRIWFLVCHTLAIPGFFPPVPHPVPIHGTERGIAMKRTLMRQRTPARIFPGHVTGAISPAMENSRGKGFRNAKLEELFVNPKSHMTFNVLFLVKVSQKSTALLVVGAEYINKW